MGSKVSGCRGCEALGGAAGSKGVAGTSVAWFLPTSGTALVQEVRWTISGAEEDQRENKRDKEHTECVLLGWAVER